AGHASDAPRNLCALLTPNPPHSLSNRTDRLRELPLRRWQAPMTLRARIAPATPRLRKKSLRRTPEARKISRKCIPRIQIHLRQQNLNHLLSPKSILSTVARSS